MPILVSTKFNVKGWRKEEGIKGGDRPAPREKGKIRKTAQQAPIGDRGEEGVDAASLTGADRRRGRRKTRRKIGAVGADRRRPGMQMWPSDRCIHNYNLKIQ